MKNKTEFPKALVMRKTLLTLPILLSIGLFYSANAVPGFNETFSSCNQWCSVMRCDYSPNDDCNPSQQYFCDEVCGPEQ